MKSSTARWTTAMAAAACLAVPSAGLTQTPATSQPPTTQQQPSTQQPPSTSASQPSGEAQEHLRQAQAALKDIPETIPAPAKSRVAELKRHLNTLEKPSASKKSTWSTEVAAIDKILTELVGPASGSGKSEPTGTTGAPGATASKSAATMTLDETTKSKLLDVRKHVTAYAAAMSGTGGEPASAPSSEPAATEPAAAAATQPPAAQSNPSTPSPSPAAQPEPTAPTAGQQPPAQNPPSAEQAQQPTPGQQADPETSKRHLTAARESLSQLTQLPAAAQLSGEPRAQVSQLISNFNELITTKENWRASYDKVEANVTALLGPQAAGETAQAPPAPTDGAVGTTGTTAASIDPAIRAKLVEFRSHLKQFEQAAGAASSASSMTSSSTSSMASQSPSPTGTPGATGTTGTTDTPQSASAPRRPASAMGQDDAVRHIEAIETILKGSSTPGATTGNAPAGTTGTTTGSITLNQSQVEEIRMHLAELRKAVDKK
jgi:hypothetical protein